MSTDVLVIVALLVVVAAAQIGAVLALVRIGTALGYLDDQLRRNAWADVELEALRGRVGAAREALDDRRLRS